MAGDWIKMRSNLWDDPRIGALVDATDSSEAAVVGALYWLWATADQHTEDGVMPGLTLRHIDRKTGITGFGSALVSVGWLSEQDAGVVLPNFSEHNGASAKRRATDAQRKANTRSVSANDADKERTNDGHIPPCLGAREREEKREEEKSGNSPSGELPTSIDVCPHSAIVELYHATLPTARRIRDWTPARQSALRARWREKPERQELDWWQKFFAYVAKSDFLCGRSPAPSGRKSFELSLDWLCKSENFVKVVEGAYES